jgi:predicted dehydrogenase
MPDQLLRVAKIRRPSLNPIYKFGICECAHPHIFQFVSEMLALGHELIGICDPDPFLAGPAASKYGVPHFTNEAEFFGAGPQIVGTSAVNDRKIGILEKCAGSGIHVMADKPVLTSMMDYKRLETVMADDRIEIGMMLTERFHPLINALRILIAEGKIGEPISFGFQKPHKLSVSNRQDWHFSKKQNGGIIVDIMIHDIDLLRWFTGSEIGRCSGFASKTGFPQWPTFFDSAQLSLRTESGAIATMDADWRMPENFHTWGDSRIFCTGTEGKAELRASGDISTRKPVGYLIPADGNGTGFEEIKPVPQSVNLTTDFLRRIEGKEDVVLKKNDILYSTLASLQADETVERIIKS